MARRVAFTEDGARRVAEATRAYERGNRDMPGVRFRTAASDDQSIRLGTISATWSKGSTATVTQQNGDGTAMAGSPTFTAKNYFSTVTVLSGTKRVACALIDATWVLIAAEC